MSYEVQSNMPNRYVPQPQEYTVKSIAYGTIIVY